MNTCPRKIEGGTRTVPVTFLVFFFALWLLLWSLGLLLDLKLIGMLDESALFGSFFINCTRWKTRLHLPVERRLALKLLLISLSEMRRNVIGR